MIENAADSERAAFNGQIEAWLNAGRPVAEATVICTWGSPPVPVGGRMIIAGIDDFQGSVSGGCVEADVITAALDVMAGSKPQSLIFGIADETAWRAGLPCGSKIRVYVQRINADDAALFSAATEAVRAGRSPRVVATRLGDGVRRVYATAGNAPAEIAAAFESGQSCVHSNDGAETFANVLIPPPRIVIVGATHVAQVLSQLAKAVGYDAVVIDPRSAFTSASRFDADTAITGWPEQEISSFAGDPYTAIVTLTHVGHIDDEALKIAVRSKCRYVGALGSRKTHAARIARLQADGFTGTEVARIHAPVGLDIGGKTPGEIAISILAEIVAAFNGKVTA